MSCCCSRAPGRRYAARPALLCRWAVLLLALQAERTEFARCFTIVIDRLPLAIIEESEGLRRSARLI